MLNRQKSFFYIVSMVVLVLGLTACPGGSGTTQPTNPPKETKILTFEATPNSISQGESTLLTWTTSDVGSVDGQPFCQLFQGDMSGEAINCNASKSITNLTETTQFILAAKNIQVDAEAIKKSITVTVEEKSTDTEIEFLKEQNNKSNIPTGDTIIIEWKVNNLPSDGKCFLNIDPQGDEPLTRSEVACEGSSPQTPSKTTSYTLQANAKQGNFVSSSLIITVEDNTEPANQAPIANNDEYFAVQGQTIKINTLEGVLANDSDPEGKPLTASVQNQPTQGTLNLNNDGSFTYNHNGSTNNDSFTYQASDGQTTTTATATINITENIPQIFSVNNGTNDAEEYLGGDNDGNILLNSTDLNFGEGGWVGLRFENITIPADATIVQAYVQFATNDTITAKTSIGSPKITIYLEDTLNPAAFTDTPFNISSRPKTNTDEWFPPVWSVAGQQGSSQQADVTQSIKTALNKLGWQSGNAIVLIFTSFDGERIAETFDGIPDKSAELRVIIR